MIPPITVHSVPIVVIVFGWTRRRTSQSPMGPMIRRYPLWIESQIRFMRRGAGVRLVGRDDHATGYMNVKQKGRSDTLRPLKLSVVANASNSAATICAPAADYGTCQ